MAGPLSGVPGQPIPLSSPYSPGQTPAEQVRTAQDQQPAPNQVQPQNAPAAQTQESQAETENDGDRDDRIQQALSSISEEDRATTRRGSVVDITV